MQVDTIQYYNQSFRLQDSSFKRTASIGEKTLFLMNNKKEWEMLQKQMRAVGLTTNGAARHFILDYLQKMPEPNEEIRVQLNDHEESKAPRRLSKEYLVASLKSGLHQLKEKKRVLSSRST